MFPGLVCFGFFFFLSFSLSLNCQNEQGSIWRHKSSPAQPGNTKEQRWGLVELGGPSRAGWAVGAEPGLGNGLTAVPSDARVICSEAQSFPTSPRAVSVPGGVVRQGQALPLGYRSVEHFVWRGGRVPGALALGWGGRGSRRCCLGAGELLEALLPRDLRLAAAREERESRAGCVGTTAMETLPFGPVQPCAGPWGSYPEGRTPLDAGNAVEHCMGGRKGLGGEAGPRGRILAWVAFAFPSWAAPGPAEAADR